MTRKLLGLATVLLFALAAHAQPNRPVRERIESMRIAFITDKLALSPEESQRFWPLYNEYQEKEKAIRQSYKDDMPPPEMTEEEAVQYIQNSFAMEQELLDLKKQYYSRLREAVSARKIARLPRIERAFKERLLEELQNRRMQNAPRRGGG